MRGLSQLIAAEYLKLRTTRTFLLLAGVTLGLMGLVALGVSAATDLETEDDLRAALSTVVGGIMALVLAVVGTAGEYRHGTITGAFLVTPERRRVVLAKVLAYGLAGAALGLASEVAVASVTGLWHATSDAPSTLAARDIAGIFAGSAAYWAFMAMLGVALGLLLRNQAAAVVLAVLFLLLVQPTVAALASDVARYLPTAAAGAVASDPNADTDLLSPVAGATVALAWVALLVSAGAYVTERRDVT